ncbi:MAG: DNA methyltransferase [Bacteroidota bacterium]|nr:DNA methyltransferase [Bacteroidota bacterium]
MKSTKFSNGVIFNEDFLQCVGTWNSPTVIVSDGPYGINGYKGDLLTTEGLSEWYKPFIKIWYERSQPNTTLWFWNTEEGWATVHNEIVSNGWDFVNCHTWNKGIAHIAGNVNSKTIRHFPKVTEVCVQYVRKNRILTKENQELSLKDWLRYEWRRSGLPLSKANQACEVKNAATRKYLTQCHLWYFPPAEAFQKLVSYANANGIPNGRPYFSVDGRKSLSSLEWEQYRSKFNYIHGITNVWNTPPLNGIERLKNGLKTIHSNQKPLNLLEIIIKSTSDINDIIWEPFGGLCTVSLAANNLNRYFYASEIDPEIYKNAIKRFLNTAKVTSRVKVLELVA